MKKQEAKKRSHNHFHTDKKAWVVAVNMGYGHQRAAYPLRGIAKGGKVLIANSYRGIPERDKKTWEDSRAFYEFISKFKRVPVIGKWAFDAFDTLQSIPQFYPKRDLSKPNLQVKSLYYLIHKREWGKHLINKLAKNPLPLVTTFFSIAFMADEYDYPGPIYVLATDTDISRSWVPLKPTKSRIQFFAPNVRVYERLKEYGICEDRIFLTGFPLPHENIGDEDSILHEDIAARIPNLDPRHKYLKRYRPFLEKKIYPIKCAGDQCRPPTIMFAVGGAGAQRDIAITIANSLKTHILQNKVNMILVAGIHNDVNRYFTDNLRAIGLGKTLKKQIQIIHSPNKQEYFRKFNQALRKTDILWTKPSELSFYTALGIPIIMSHPIGSQEKFNRRWLFTVGSGIDMEDPKYTHQWLMDWLESGWFAEAAVQGFLEAPRHGAYNIGKIIAGRKEEVKAVRSLLQY